jgi:hypothetical protein
MIRFLRKHWPFVLGIALQLNSVIGFITWALDWRSRYDAFTETLNEVGGVSGAIGRILNPPLWLYPCAFVLGLVLIYWDNWRNRAAVSIAHPTTAQPTETDPLQITFGHEAKTAVGLYKTMHTFSVDIKNVSQTQFLSNCKAFIDIPDEGSVTPKSYLIVDSFTLNAAEERLVPIVQFDEPATVSGHKGSTIQLMIPVVVGYYNVGWGWPWRLPVGAYTFEGHIQRNSGDRGCVQGLSR